MSQTQFKSFFSHKPPFSVYQKYFSHPSVGKQAAIHMCSEQVTLKVLEISRKLYILKSAFQSLGKNSKIFWKMFIQNISRKHSPEAAIQKVFCKNTALENFAKFTEKYLCWYFKPIEHLQLTGSFTSRKSLVNFQQRTSDGQSMKKTFQNCYFAKHLWLNVSDM